MGQDDSTYLSNQSTFAAVFGDGSMRTASLRCDTVRYVVVACLTVALFDRIIWAFFDFRRVWHQIRLTVPKCLYIVTRCLNIACLVFDVYTVTAGIGDDDCLWWFGFRAWVGAIVILLMEAAIFYKLFAIYDNSKCITVAFAILIIPQVIVHFLWQRSALRQVTYVESPGEWFTGCFPVIRSDLMWPCAVWVASIQLFVTLAAVTSSVRSWLRAAASFWSVMSTNSIPLFLGITATGLFITVFWIVAPFPLVLMLPSIASTLYSILGCRLLLSLPHFSRDSIPNADEDAKLKPRQKEAEVLTRSEADMVDLEKGTTGFSPYREAPQSLRPIPDEQRRSNSTCGSHIEFAGRSEETIAPSPGCSCPDICQCKNLSKKRLSPLHPISPAETAPVSPSSPVTSPKSLGPHPREEKDAAAHASEEQDDELDMELAELYDEEGRRRPVRRTHQRRWRSEEVLPNPALSRTLSTPSIASPPTGFARFVSPTPKSPPPTQSPSAQHSTIHHPPPPLDDTESQNVVFPASPTSSRSRIGHLFHRSDRCSVRGSRRMLLAAATSPPPSPSSPSSFFYRPHRNSRLVTGDSDAMTICTVSTGFAFDNTNVFDVPDFK